MCFPARLCSSPTAAKKYCAPATPPGSQAQDSNGHCLQNRSGEEARVLEVGTRVPGDTAYYSEIDMVAPADGKPAIYTRRDGTPYLDIRRRGPE